MENNDMYASMINLYGTSLNVISLFNNVLKLDAVKQGSIPIGVKCNLYTSFEKITDNSSNITFEIDEGSVFCFDLKNKAYSPQLEIKAVTDRSAGICKADGILLHYQGLTSLELVIAHISRNYNIVIQDILGMIVPISQIDQLKQAYAKYLHEKNQ